MSKTQKGHSNTQSGLPPRMTVVKDEVHWGPGSDPLSFPDTVEYLSLAEHEHLLAEAVKKARAEAFEECARAIRTDVALEDGKTRIAFGASRHTYNMFMEAARAEAGGGSDGS